MTELPRRNRETRHQLELSARFFRRRTTPAAAETGSARGRASSGRRNCTTQDQSPSFAEEASKEHASSSDQRPPRSAVVSVSGVAVSAREAVRERHAASHSRERPTYPRQTGHQVSLEQAHTHSSESAGSAVGITACGVVGACSLGPPALVIGPAKGRAPTTSHRTHRPMQTVAPC